MDITLFGILAFLALLALVYWKFGFQHNVVATPNPDIDEKALAEAEENLKTANADTDWRVLKRLAGPAYTHASLVELVAKLEEAGVEASYENIASSAGDIGLTNFLLKVRPGFEEKALEILESYEK